MKTPNQTSRIQKAIALIESGAVTPMSEGCYAVRTERMNIQYTVTLTGCNCFDFTETLKGAAPCKHMWAAIGATAAVLISEIHTAQTITELESVGRKYSDAMQNIHESFKRIAREEYKARHAVLTAFRKSDPPCQPAPAVKTRPVDILVKPQPKSNGRYEGIEI